MAGRAKSKLEVTHEVLDSVGQKHLDPHFETGCPVSGIELARDQVLKTFVRRHLLTELATKVTL